jgi:hypothetical protein
MTGIGVALHYERIGMNAICLHQTFITVTIHRVGEWKRQPEWHLA